MTGAANQRKIALVTGAAQGIGRAIALGLARQGAVVVCGDVEGSSATAHMVRSEGGDVHDVTLDVSQGQEVQEVMSFVDGIGGMDILVNNAGIFPRSAVLDMEDHLWDWVQAVNLRGTFLSRARLRR